MEPSVTCVMLTAGRHEMAQRAIRSFLSQTYEPKRLLIWDTGAVPLNIDPIEGSGITHRIGAAGPIGALRNEANLHAQSEIIVHWDSDDISDPRRLELQVKLLLEHPELECVGFRSLPFYDTRKGETWLYSSYSRKYACGTSLCYWRRAWEKRPFPSVVTGEDTAWLNVTKSLGVSCFVDTPLMIATIHGGNTSSKVKPGAREWTRRPDLDEWCKGRLNG